MNAINCTASDDEYADWEAFKRNSDFYTSLCTNESRSGELLVDSIMYCNAAAKYNSSILVVAVFVWQYPISVKIMADISLDVMQ